MKTYKLYWIIGFFFILLITRVQAVTIESGTIVQSEGLNLTFNFTEIAYANQIIIDANSIYFSQFSRNNGNEHLTFNLTEANASYNGTALPYISSSTTTQKTIVSTLADNITADVVLDLGSDTTELRYLIVTYPNSTVETFENTWTRSGNLITINLDIQSGDTDIELTTAECTTWERIMYPILLMLIAVLVLIGCIFFLKGDLDYNNMEEWKNLSIRNLIISIIFIILALAFITTYADTFAVRCTL